MFFQRQSGACAATGGARGSRRGVAVHRDVGIQSDRRGSRDSRARPSNAADHRRGSDGQHIVSCPPPVGSTPGAHRRSSGSTFRIFTPAIHRDVGIQSDHRGSRDSRARLSNAADHRHQAAPDPRGFLHDISVIAARLRCRPYRLAGHRTRNRQAAPANREPACPRRIEQPSRRGQVRFDGRKSCTTRSAAPWVSLRCLVSWAGRVPIL